MYICNVMRAVKNSPLFIGFLLLTSTLFAKNTNDVELSSKKDQIQKNLLSQLGSDILFEKNDGQYEGDFDYRYNGSNACVDFYEDKVVFSLRKVVKKFDPQKLDEPMKFDFVVWEIDLNSNENTKILGNKVSQPQNVNYFDADGHNIKKKVAQEIVYTNVYNNIDLRFYKDKAGQLKYDFILKPQAKLSDIRLDYKGVEDLTVTKEGMLSYQTDWGEIMEDKPFSYVESNGNEVEINYVVKDNQLQFSSNFNEVQETIVLDPIYVDWSTYFYGTGNNGTTWAYTWVMDLDIDDSNNVYVTGMTNDRFPGLINTYDTSRNGWYDGFICKIAPDGDSIVWFSYIGGSSFEYSFSLAVNSQQQPVISGFTNSSDFPTTAGAFDATKNGMWYDGFITKFTAAGDSLVFSTFFGGSGSTLIHSITLDNSNNIFLTGRTNSQDFPTTSGCFQSSYGGGGSTWWSGGDAFLTKINPTGSSIIFSTYVGGAGDDEAYEVALSPNNDIYIVGKTSSSNFPVTPGSPIFNFNILGPTDGFICKFKPNGSTMHFSKMMGGSSEDWFEGVYVNSYDQAYVAGISKSSNFYTTNSAVQTNHKGGADMVAVKFNALGQNVIYSTYIGGSGDEMYYSGFIYNSNVRIAANVREEAIICGISRSNDFPVTTDALMTSNPSSTGATWWNSAATITKLDYRANNILYGTYYGGSSYEVPGANKLKRISCYTNILYGGFTNSADYPTTNGVYKEAKSTTNSFWTGFISKFRDTLYTELIDLGLADTITDCDQVYEFLDAKNIGADIIWSTGETYHYEIVEQPGTYWVQATYGCDTVRDTITINLEHSPTVPILPFDSIYCDTFPDLMLDAKNDTIMATYAWSTGDTTQTINVDQVGEYIVNISTPRCGTKSDSVLYVLRTTPEVILPVDSIFCDSVNMVVTVGVPMNDEFYSWNTLDSVPSITILDTGYYEVKIQNMCGVDSAGFNALKLYSPNTVLPLDSEFCNTINYPIVIGLKDNDEAYFINDLTNSKSLVPSDSFTLTEAALYEVITSNKCGVSKDTIELSLLYTPTVDLGEDTTFCDAVSYPIDVSLANNKEVYTWENGYSGALRTITLEGDYWVEISNKCGVARDSVRVDLVETPIASLPEDSVFCDNINIVLDAAIQEPSQYVWQDGQTKSSITATSIGKYIVSISNYCGVSTDSMTIGLIESPIVDLGADEIFCGAITPIDYTVGKADNEEIYLWSDNGTVSTNTLSTLGKHWVRIGNKCAVVSDTIEYSVSPNPTVDLGPDTTLCGNFKVVLDAGNAGMKYLWEPYGETTQSITATEQRVYKVTVYNEHGCEGSDEFEIDGGCISHYYIPTGFTPNGDGRNDFFRPSLINYEDFSMQIFNRWGELIFETNDPIKGWDGTYKGVDVQTGVYLYVLRFKTTENLQYQNIDGLVNVLR
jgi:gliding motility-associated-like protein